MSTKAAVGILALIVIAAGLIVGLVPHSIDINLTALQTQSCGSAFAPRSSSDLRADQSDIDYLNALSSTDVTGQRTVSQQCSDALGTPRTFALVLVGLGALAGLFLLMTSVGKREAATAPEDTVDRA